MDQTEITLTIIGMALVTYLPRCMPVLFLSGRTLSPLIIAWLRLIPPAILAAMLVPILFCPADAIDLSRNNLFLWASFIAFPIAIKSRSLCLTVLVGMGFVALGRYLGFGFN